MKLDDKIAAAKHLIYEFGAAKPALMCSFGKDSMVLLHLIREVLPLNRMSTHAYPVPIIYHRHPWFAMKNMFADSVIRSWALEVHDYPPLVCGVKFKKDRLELVARYRFGEDGAMDLPMNTEEPISRRDFVCGLNDWILRPKMELMTFPWQNVFIGHKSADIDLFDGRVPLHCDNTTIGKAELVFPLRHWSDDDVWDYIEAEHVPYDMRRYKDRAEIEDKWLNPDYLHACTRCIDPRNKAEQEVDCPKTGGKVPNIGQQVLRLQQRPDYIGENEEEQPCQIQ